MLRRLKKDKKGNSNIEFILVLFTFVILFSFFMDILLIAMKNYTVSQNLNQITRRICIQGGIGSTTPVGFPGGEDNYMTNEEIVAYLEKEFKGVDIKSTDWELNMTGRRITLNGNNAPTYTDNVSITLSPQNNSAILNVDDGDSITVSISFNYRWTLWGQLFPNLNSLYTKTYYQHTLSDFKFDYDYWESEHQTITDEYEIE